MSASLPSLPSDDTVTMAFVEISGATVLWDSHAARFQSLAAACLDVLRAHVTAHAGTLINMSSEGKCFVVFPGAVSALSCVCEVLTQIYRTHWPDDFAPHGLRAALATGIPIRSGDDYLGPLVNRCARMVEIAAPWQILLNEAAAAQIGAAPSPEVRLTDIGDYRLRDIEERTRLFWADYAALPRTASLPSARLPSRLPALLTSFIGRAQESAHLLCLLRDPQARLITLFGVGGCGKTRLAIETLRQIEPEFTHGVWFLPFTDSLSREALIAAIARVIGCAREPDGSMTWETLADWLRDRRCVLALDGFERLAEHGALLNALLAAAPELKCIVTSRTVLHARDEVLFPVPTLEIEDAVCLLADRAQTARSDFAVTPENAEALHAICRQLDGLPLALELAAPLLRGLSPAHLLTRMQQRWLDLAPPRRDTDPRHQTLRHCLDWSYEALSERDRALFIRLAVFEGDFTQEAVEILCAEAADTAALSPPPFLERVSIRESLRRLCDNSLLTSLDTGQGTRCRMLDIGREFALEKHSENGEELAAIRLRHARYYASLVREMRARFTAQGGSGYFQACAAEMPNLRAGMKYAQNRREHALFAEYVRELSPYFIEQGMWEEFQLCAPLAMRYLEAREDWHGLATLLSFRAHCAERSGDFPAAIQDLERALALGERGGHTHYVCETIYNLGLMYRQLGDWDGAQRRFEQALQQARGLGYAMMTDVALSGLGEVALGRGDLEAAQRLLAAARANFAAREERLGVASADVSLARIAAARGDFHAAHDYLVECLRLRSATGERYATLHAICHIAQLFLEARSFPAAAALFLFVEERLEQGRGVLWEKARTGLEACLQEMPDTAVVIETFAGAIALSQDAAHLVTG